MIYVDTELRLVLMVVYCTEHISEMSIIIMRLVTQLMMLMKMVIMMVNRKRPRENGDAGGACYSRRGAGYLWPVGDDDGGDYGAKQVSSNRQPRLQQQWQRPQRRRHLRN